MPGLQCFVAGVRLQTPSGQVPVESLREGDLITAEVDGRLMSQPILWVGRRSLTLLPDATPYDGAPIRVRRDALAAGVPVRDVMLSHDHRILVGGVLIPVRLLVNGMTILAESGASLVQYFHIELENHAILLADGLPSESFLDETGDRSFFSNASEVVAYQPVVPGTVAPAVAARACAPLAMTAADSEAAWRKLFDRACTLGFTPPVSQTTTEPDLHLLADGNPLRPVAQDETHCVFALPAGTRELRLGSRATVPFDLDRAHEDWRRLGVAVTRIVYRIGAEQIDIQADHPSLILGWHDTETDGATIWRWTNGDAHLPLPAPIEAGATLELHLSGRATYALTEDRAEATRLSA